MHSRKTDWISTEPTVMKVKKFPLYTCILYNHCQGCLQNFDKMYFSVFKLVLCGQGREKWGGGGGNRFHNCLCMISLIRRTLNVKKVRGKVPPRLVLPPLCAVVAFMCSGSVASWLPVVSSLPGFLSLLNQQRSTCKLALMGCFSIKITSWSN